RARDLRGLAGLRFRGVDVCRAARGERQRACGRREGRECRKLGRKSFHHFVGSLVGEGSVGERGWSWFSERTHLKHWPIQSSGAGYSRRTNRADTKTHE